MLKKFAFVVTRIFDPLISIILYLSFILLKSDLTIQQKFLLGPIILLLAILFPSIYFYVLLKERRITDWDTTERTERFPLFTFIIGCWTIVLLASYLFGTPAFFRSFIAFYILALFIVGITFFWKISVHASFLTFTVIYFIVLSPTKLWWLLMLIPIVLWSRYFLGKHTLIQLFAGALLAIVVFSATISL